MLSKARARWGQEVFERLFVGTVEQCVEAGLVDGKKLHVDSSLIDADASQESVIKGATGVDCSAQAGVSGYGEQVGRRRHHPRELPGG